MNKAAISVTLESDNLLWLKGRARAIGSRSLSAALDAILREAREARGEIRSVVGRVRFPSGGRGLERGRKEVADLFERSLSRRRRG